MTDPAKMPDGHIRIRIEEITECIRTDERHLAYLKDELKKYTDEQTRRKTE